LQQAGLDIPSTADLLPDEMLLFYQVVTRARRRLVLSYPAVDERGQELLPSSFLGLVRECFEPEAIPVERRSMLLEGLDRDIPLSPSEYRVRLARARRSDLPLELDAPTWYGSGCMTATTAPTTGVPQSRGHRRRRTPVRPRASSVHGSRDCVACPFKFFLRHGLRPKRWKSAERSGHARGRRSTAPVALHQQLGGRSASSGRGG
jgi:hypothetical protein